MTVSDESWQVQSSERVVNSPFFRLRREEVLLPNGQLIPDYYVIEGYGWAGIVPLTRDGRFLINRQYKHGAREVIYEFPAGGIDEGETDPLLAANRELMEETGYSTPPEEMQVLAKMFSNPTHSASFGWWFLARNIEKTGEQKIDPAEVIENLLVTPRELLAMIHAGTFAVQGHIAAAYLALETLGYFHFKEI